jgi:hypothetical protein
VGEVRDVDVVKAQAEVDRAIASLRQTQEDLELSRVNAPTDGQIIKSCYAFKLLVEKEVRSRKVNSHKTCNI